MKARRDNSRKPPLSYLLAFPEALRGFAAVCRHGERKYAKMNFAKWGKPSSEYVDCILRHLLKWNEGEDLDSESGQNHLSHVVWNALALAHSVIAKRGIDDRPHVVLRTKYYGLRPRCLKDKRKHMRSRKGRPS